MSFVENLISISLEGIVIFIERGTSRTIIAQTPIEVAELGQFYLLPGLQEEYSPELELILETLLPT